MIKKDSPLHSKGRELRQAKRPDGAEEVPEQRIADFARQVIESRSRADTFGPDVAHKSTDARGAGVLWSERSGTRACGALEWRRTRHGPHDRRPQPRHPDPVTSHRPSHLSRVAVTAVTPRRGGPA